MNVSFVESVDQRPGFTAGILPEACPTRTVLDHVTSKWGVLVLLALCEDTLRWGELRRVVQGISEKMLAQTLRTLDQDGLVIRVSYPEIPPRVEYSLSDRGRDLTERLLPLMSWIDDNAAIILGNHTKNRTENNHTESRTENNHTESRTESRSVNRPANTP